MVRETKRTETLKTTTTTRAQLVKLTSKARWRRASIRLVNDNDHHCLSHRGDDSIDKDTLNSKQKPYFCLAAASLLLVVGLLIMGPEPARASIGYFEHYGWPTYGIVKPFWMTPFSAFPSRSISGYSRKHPMYNGRGLLRFKDY